MEKKTEIRHLVFANKYLNAPCYDGKVYLRLLERAVYYIGKEYGVVSGSNKKKGIHYIAKKVGCHKRQIRLMLQSVPNQIIRETDTAEYVLRCHIENYCAIYGCILKHLSHVEKGQFHNELIKEAERVGATKPSFSDVLILSTVNALHNLEIEGKNQKIKATALLMQKEIKEKDEAYPFVSSD